MRFFLITLACVCFTNSATAQSFGGSFDTTTSTQTAPVAGGSFDTSPSGGTDPNGGGFGGSFDNTTTSGSQPAPVPNPPPQVGGDDFSGGSFDPAPAPPSPTPQPQPTPVVPAPNPAPPQPGPAPQPPNNTVDPQILAFETRDFGVPPTDQLRNGQFHAATPTAIPGGNFVSTQGLAEALQGGVQMILIDVLGGEYALPNAYMAPGLAQAGSFQDRNQQQAAQWLSQITGGNRNIPIVIYCSDPQCWLSYNAALRTINAGYSEVYWYRGGLRAWQMAGLPTQPASF